LLIVPQRGMATNLQPGMLEWEEMRLRNMAVEK
jgi:hypothetical protein